MKGIIDSTLREGSQAVGVLFRDDDRLRLFAGLVRTGVEEIEVDIAAGRNSSLPRLMAGYRKIAAGGPSPPRIALWCRCREEDIRLAAALRPDVLSLSVPASDLHRQIRLGIGRDQLLRLLDEAVRLARSLGDWRVSVGFEDGSRADRDFLGELMAVAATVGAFRIRLADTVGILSPERMAALVRFARMHFPGEIGVHTHNDFGMATANAVAALDAGADWADATLLGLGERAGNARLEEIAAYLTAGPGPRRSYRLEALRALALQLAGMIDRPVDAARPIIGADIFSCETGLHLSALQQEPATYEPFAPELVGSDRRLLIGAKTGRRAVAQCLARLGAIPSTQLLERVVDKVRAAAAAKGTPLTDGELLRLAAEG
ncbi:MAG: pyruvate carboxyltransferase [Thermodesulfobacteriota bacterium]